MIKDLVYDNTTYLRDKDFNINITECYIHVTKDIYVIKLFKWEDVCDELEPLLYLLYSKGLLKKVITYNVNDGNGINSKSNISEGLDNIFKKIFDIGNISDIIICLKF